MSDLKIFESQEFGKIRVLGTSKNPLFCAADVCRALGYTNNRKAIADHVEKDDVTKRDTIDNLGRTQQVTYINESGLYALIFGSKLPQAKQFKTWVTSEVLPSIRKHGVYATDEFVELSIENPDYVIKLLTKFKEERKLRAEAEEKNRKLSDENTYQSQVIEGLTEDIPLADMRQRISQIIQKGGGDLGYAYRLLYSEFNKKYHVNLGVRLSNPKYEKMSVMDYIDKVLGMIPELYELTCKLFEEEYDKLMKQWGRNVLRARGGKVNRTK